MEQLRIHLERQERDGASPTERNVTPRSGGTSALPSVLRYLESLTFSFERDGRRASCVRIYNEPAADADGEYQAVVAAESGFEGVACVDDTARAALLALRVFEQSGSRPALRLAKRWLSFVEYMQYPDGEFANFIRTNSGVRNATGQTSVKGGYWWSVRALLALAAAYSATGTKRYLTRYLRCSLAPIEDGKLQAVLALGELELYRVMPSEELRSRILERCRFIVGRSSDPYFLDQPNTEVISMWGYHQLHAVASAALAFQDGALARSCRRTVNTLIEPDVRACFWHAYPSKQKDGVCAYDVAPIVQGLRALHDATGSERYRRLAIRASEWFYGRNDAGVAMYDPALGRCRDGITDGQASENFGAESAIEAGFAELERAKLLAMT